MNFIFNVISLVSISIHFSCIRHYALKLRPFTKFKLLFSFLEFILTLLFDLWELGSRDLLVQVAY